MKCNQCDYQSNDITLFVLHNQVHELAALRAERDELREALETAAQMVVTYEMTHPADFNRTDKRKSDYIRAVLAKYSRKDTPS